MLKATATTKHLVFFAYDAWGEPIICGPLDDRLMKLWIGKAITVPYAPSP